MSESLITFFISRAPELMQKIYEQLFLAGSGIILAILISVPLGIWIARNDKIRGPVLGAVNILQTIPSLAVLAFLIPFVGIGVKPAIITLTIYALLPIVRNTTTGILNVSPILIEAADSLGLTTRQKLTRVELPVALPVILGGIRTATTLCVGTATLAAFVGGGGLGDFIYQGLSLNNHRLILLGAIPAALLVLVLDFVISHIENLFDKKHKRENVKKNYFKTTVVSMIVVLFMIKPASFFLAKCQDNVIRVGARYDAEQMILGEIIAQTIENKTHLNVVRKFNLMSAGMAQEALTHHQVDIIPEYTGTAYLVTLQGDMLKKPKNLYGFVKDVYHKRFHFAWLKPFGFNNSNALAVSESLSKKYHLKNISDLRPYSKRWKIAVPSDFYQRDDGYKALHKQYGLSFADVKLMEPGLLYSAVHNHQVNMAMGSSTDGRLIAENLMILNDDRHVFPDYSAVPVVNEKILKRHPEIEKALASVLGKIDEKTIRDLNYKVDIGNQSVACVVSVFLSCHTSA